MFGTRCVPCLETARQIRHFCLPGPTKWDVFLWVKKPTCCVCCTERCCVLSLLFIQLRTMDHSARRSMKNAANCEKYGELQGSRNRNMSNAYGASNIPMLEARLSEGLFDLLTISFEETFLTKRIAVHAVIACSPWFSFFCKRSPFLSSHPRARSRCRVLAGASGARPSWVKCDEKSREAFPFLGPQIRRGYPPNLSISFSGGKETKEDSLSNGERTGISPAPNLPPLGAKECGVREHHLSVTSAASQVRWNAALTQRG